MANLSNLRPPKGQVKKKRRLGQGMGTGRGKYAGRGQKGQKSISGYSRMRGFEGGQMPLHRRLPKRGFTNIFKKEFTVINIGDLAQLEGDSFNPQSIIERGISSKIRANGLKILGDGDVNRKLTITAHAVTQSARKKIEAAGGTVELIPAKIGGAQPRKDGKKSKNVLKPQ
jgi:large subunit ribosomal protein L15